MSAIAEGCFLFPVTFSLLGTSSSVEDSAY